MRMTAPALDYFEVNGRGMAHCPAHEDRQRSLSVKQGSDGKWLVFCQAGCETSAVMAAAGGSMADLFPKPDLRVVPSSQPIARYDYHAADGSLAFYVNRYEGKRFAMYKPDGSALGDAARLPYRLDEWANADPSRAVFVVEGEKDADRLASLEMLATTNPGGSNAWRPEFGPYFAGRRVVILLDNDDAGEKHAAAVLASIRDEAAEVRIVRLPDVPPKGDVSDYLLTHELAELRAVVKATPPEPNATGAVSMLDFLAERLDPPRWLVDGLVPVGPSVGALVGSFKHGKSLAGLQLCIVTARGSSDFLGHAIEDGGPAVFVEYEGSRARLQERVRTMATKYGLLGQPVPLEVIHRPEHKIDTDAGEAWLRRICRGRVLCVIGPVSKAASIQRENEPAEWAALAERLQRVADATGCSVMLVHHTRKPSMDGAPRQVSDYFLAARGSNSYMGAVDFAIGVQRDPDASEGVLYSLQRDGASEREPYTFDASSLCIWPDDRPLRQANRTDRLESLYGYIEDNPGCTRKDIMAGLGYTLDNLRDHLAMLGQRINEDGEGRQIRTYRVAT